MATGKGGGPALIAVCALLALLQGAGSLNAPTSACLKTILPSQLLVKPTCANGMVISSVSFAGWGNTDLNTATCVATPNTCNAAGALAYTRQLCMNQQSCSLTRALMTSVFGDPTPCTASTALLQFAGTCGYGGSYYTTNTSGCSIGTSTACCTASWTCAGGDSYQNGVCVSSCSPEYTSYMSANSKPFCLSSTCLLANSSDCSQCVQCATGYGVALDGSCQLLPSLNVTSSLFPGVNLCDGIQVQTGTSGSHAYSDTFIYTPSAAAQSILPNSSPATISSTSCTSSAQYTGGVPANTVYAGVAYFNCTTVDTNNLAKSCLFSVQVSDMSPPVVSCPSNLTLPNVAGANYSEIDVSATGPFSTLSAYDNYDFTSVSPLYCSYSFTATENPDINRIYLNPSGAAVITPITCIGGDSSGNIGNCTFYVKAYDNEPPVLSGCPANSDILLGAQTAFGTYAWTQPMATDNVDTPAPVPVCNYTGSIFYIGATNVLCSATDKAGNINTCNFTVSVTDGTKPNITKCPSPATVSTDLNKNSTSVNWTYAVYDNSGAYTISYLPVVVPGQIFEAGVYTITMTATDSSLNADQCTFVVTVKDTQSPTITNCPSNASYTMIYTNYTVLHQTYGLYMIPTINTYDNVKVATSSYIGTLSTYPIGETLVTFVAYDTADPPNHAECAMKVNIIDNELPTFISCPEGQTFSCNTNAGSNLGPCVWPVINQTDNVVTGLTGAYTSLPIGFTYGSLFSFGTTNMTYTIQDKAGNKNYCHFSVQIKDIEPPTFQRCPSTSLRFNTNATGSQWGYATWDNTQPADNVGLAGTEVSNLLPGSYLIGLYNVTINATDTSGNWAICNFTFSVVMASGSEGAGSTAADAIGPIAGAAGAGVLVLMLVFLVLMLRRNQRKRLQAAQAGYAELLAMSDEYILERARNIQITLMAQKQARPPAFDAHNIHPQREFKAPPSTYGELVAYITETMQKEVNRKDIVLGIELGHGEFGAVFEGTYNKTAEKTKEVKVAVKQLLAATSEDSRLRFLKEAAIMAQFDHSNIVSLIGVCVNPQSEPTLIVLEYMHLGSLYSYLQTPMIKNQLESLTLVRAAIDVCAGMVYLSEAGFVHRDLAARNVLIDKEMTCRIGDFGLSIDLATVANEEDAGIYSGSEGARIPIRWTALEAVLYRQFSASSDVWSFGVLMWEIWTYAEMPYAGWSNKKVTQMVQSGYRLPHPTGCPFDVYKLMVECWNKNPRQRPPFSRLSTSLIEIWKDINALAEGGQVYGQNGTVRPNSMMDAGSQLYDNQAQHGDSDDDEMGESGGSTMGQARGGAAAGTAVYDVGGEDLHDSADTEDVGDGGGAGQMYDVAGDVGGVTTTTKNFTMTKKPTGAVADLLGGRTKRNSLGVDTLTAKSLGSPVQVAGFGRGILKYVGPHHLTGEIYSGIALDEPLGLSDGLFEGKRYFFCENYYGVLVPAASVSIVEVGSMMNIGRMSETSVESTVIMESSIDGNSPIRAHAKLSVVSLPGQVEQPDDEDFKPVPGGYINVEAETEDTGIE